jgi:hypothetical protein
MLELVQIQKAQFIYRDPLKSNQDWEMLSDIQHIILSALEHTVYGGLFRSSGVNLAPFGGLTSEVWNLVTEN